ncbi:MAG: hypothetical protein ACE5IA_04260 [Dehalococcoidia bacterium]
MDGERLSPEALKQWSDLLGLNLGRDRLERLAPRLAGFFQDMRAPEEMIEVESEEPAFILPEEPE